MRYGRLAELWIGPVELFRSSSPDLKIRAVKVERPLKLGKGPEGAPTPLEGLFEAASQLTARLTREMILASSIAVSRFRAKSVGHMLPSSRLARSLKPSVAYRVLNF